MLPLATLTPCECGYHICREQDLVYWLGPVIWEAEARGEQIECEDKVVVAQARLVRRTPWDERVARLFAADCAERVLTLYEARHNDQRPRQAIEVARRYARGEATREGLSAASAAAYAAASAAAYAAAAYTAASAAAYARARCAEREWQTARLLAYLRGEA